MEQMPHTQSPNQPYTGPPHMGHSRLVTIRGPIPPGMQHCEDLPIACQLEVHPTKLQHQRTSANHRILRRDPTLPPSDLPNSCEDRPSTLPQQSGATTSGHGCSTSPKSSMWKTSIPHQSGATSSAAPNLGIYSVSSSKHLVNNRVRNNSQTRLVVIRHEIISAFTLPN